MGITGGFGTTIDLERGISRQWVIGRDGVKRWADSGQPLTQELLNSIMRNPGETRATAAPALPKCPQCGARYCGNGVQPCVECAAPNVGGELTLAARTET
jgi:hypothetical protein